MIAFDAKGNIRTLRPGTNQFTCIPDDPTNPANDPNCVDANGLEWVKALVSKTEPPKGKVGFGYMLQGGTTPSNVDPFATKPPAGMDWMQELPHVMMFNYGEIDGGLSKARRARRHDPALGDVGRLALRAPDVAGQIGDIFSEGSPVGQGGCPPAG